MLLPKSKRQHVWISDPSICSPAALVLLNYKLMKEDKTRNKRIWFKFRYRTLARWLQERGDLVCSYCNKKKLMIHVKYGDTANKHRTATLDHVIPLSKKGPMFDLTNLVVACYVCNCRKGSNEQPIRST